MQFFAVIAALAAVAAAAPGGSGNPQGCKPATYACTTGSGGQPGWEVCNTSGQWVYAGNCPPKTHCYFNQQNQSPYCI